MPVGLGHAFMVNLGIYGLAGLVFDAFARLKWFDTRLPFWAIGGGVAAIMAKFLFNNIALPMFNPVVKHFIIFGVFKAAVLHIIFGAIAGFLAWGGWWVWKHRPKKEAPQPS
jgi:uncharacterized membrane protein